MTQKRNYDYVGEELRKLLFEQLERVFREDIVKTKWRADKGSTDDLNRSYIYTPETDLVVGPFNIHKNMPADNHLIDLSVEHHNDVLSNINSISIIPYKRNMLNENPRCFLAMEVAGSGSEKHLLGDMFNACVLGKVGIVIGATAEVIKSYCRIYEYVNFAYDVGKIKQNFGNLAIVEGSKFMTLLQSM